MTKIAIEREQTQMCIPASFIRAFNIMLLIIGLMGSVYLLKWAVADKFAKSGVFTSSQITAEVREKQLGCLAKNIYHEAGNEPFEGKAAIAQVVLNRTDSGRFPADICGVIYQKNIVYEKVICQFSWFCSQVVAFRPINKESYDESMVVAKKVLLEGFRLPSLEKALFYHASYISPGWNRKRITQIGQHIFYE
jgi:spore germination cell wall hydrolase CwlJ-like protein